jgi:hypothetical protein
MPTECYHSREAGSAAFGLRVTVEQNTVYKAGGSIMSSPIVPKLQELLQEQPDWRLIFIACLRLSEDSPGKPFWSSGVLNLAQCQARRSLTPLRALGILETVEKSTRNYSNASYRVRDPAGFRLALVEMGIDPDERLPGDFYNLHNRKAG